MKRDTFGMPLSAPECSEIPFYKSEYFSIPLNPPSSSIPINLDKLFENNPILCATVPTKKSPKEKAHYDLDMRCFEVETSFNKDIDYIKALSEYHDYVKSNSSYIYNIPYFRIEDFSKLNNINMVKYLYSIFKRHLLLETDFEIYKKIYSGTAEKWYEYKGYDSEDYNDSYIGSGNEWESNSCTSHFQAGAFFGKCSDFDEDGYYDHTNDLGDDYKQVFVRNAIIINNRILQNTKNNEIRNILSELNDKSQEYFNLK